MLEGHLVVTKPAIWLNKLRVTFQQPVGLSEARSVRKLLELTRMRIRALLTDGSAIYGLGECIAASYNLENRAYEERARWSLSIDATLLMRVANEHATLPKQILDKDGVSETLLIAEVGEVEVEPIWDIFQCALDSDHGTTIVVSEDPVSEIKRLGQDPPLVLKPEYLDHRDVAVNSAISMGQSSTGV